MGLRQALAYLRQQLKKRRAREEEVTAALLAAAKLVASHTLQVGAVSWCNGFAAARNKPAAWSAQAVVLQASCRAQTVPL